MKKFHEFEPLHPFRQDETLQVKNRKIHLAYIPLVDSVSIKGFMQVNSPSDVVSNTFWVDYRFDDGYRSSNAEILFHSSANEKFVDISYLGIGTILRAQDMNEVADSLEHFKSIETEHINSINNLGIRIGVVAENAENDLQKHELNLSAHPTIIESISANRDEVNTRLDVVSAQISGTNSLLQRSVNSLNSKIQDIIVLCGEDIQLAENRLISICEEKLQDVQDIRNEFIGIYNSIENLDSKFQSKCDNTVHQVESLLAVERKSFSTTVNNAKSDAISRAVAESTSIFSSQFDQFRSEIDNSSLQSDFMNQIDSLNTQIEDLSTNYQIIRQLYTSEQYNRILQDNLLNDSLISIQNSIDNNLDSVTSNIANLANTLYQARQATNNQIESLRANVAIAEDRMIFISDKMDSLNVANIVLNESLVSELEGVTSMKSEMLDYIDGMFEPFRLEITNSVESAINSIDFSPVQTSITAICDSLNNFNFDTTPIEQSINAIQNSLAHIDIDTTPIEQSINAIQASIENIDFDTSPIEQSINSIQDSIENIDFDTTPIEQSISTNSTNIGNLTTSIGNTNSSLSNLTSRVNNLESGGTSDLQILTTVSSTQTGALWYIV